MLVNIRNSGSLNNIEYTYYYYFYKQLALQFLSNF